MLFETVNQQMHKDCVKRENYQRIQYKFCLVFIFQFFLLMLCISLVLLIFRYSAHILLENALKIFCPWNQLQIMLFARLHNL